MEPSAYGVSLAGGSFDLGDFVKTPQTVVRVLSWVFSVIVFATIISSGYPNHDKCIFNQNDSACSYAQFVGILAFLACVVFLVLDAYFPQISSAKDRRNIVMADLLFSGVWTFLWFVCFCFLANQSPTQSEERGAGQAVIAFSFFSIASWAILVFLAVRRYRSGVTEFDTAGGHTSYPPFGNNTPQGYQQSPFTPSSKPQGEAGYQPPAY